MKNKLYIAELRMEREQLLEITNELNQKIRDEEDEGELYK